MTFLPEDDVEFLRRKAIPYELKSETPPGGTVRNGIILPDFQFAGNLFTREGEQLVSCTTCDLMILIPPQYATTKLDSFYTRPYLKRQDGSDPQNTAIDQELFGAKWQFWSRHLAKDQWRPDIDGLETYLQHVRDALKV
ncbi:E2/UBC family protein [Bradyrhizobium sp. USDA 223]|uniref:E2/UBC family protein n=1 Tax=Bradyrhizobium sp. USDA 223 TaxID=3156306 RepID=UPI003839B9B2